jgi:metal-responsive CopG/Arc/MetJ family transcriptional regulator
MSDRVTLKIPRPLYEKLQTVIEGSGYRSVNEFVVHVLRDLVSEVRNASTDELTSREIGLIKKRLRNLGYLD